MVLNNIALLSALNFNTLILTGQVEKNSQTYIFNQLNFVLRSGTVSSDLFDDSSSEKRFVTHQQIIKWDSIQPKVQADWNMNNMFDPSYIKNTPTIPDPYPIADVQNQSSTSYVTNRIAQIDLSGYLNTANLKTLDGNSIGGSGSLTIEASYLTTEPTTDADTTYLRFVALSDEPTETHLGYIYFYPIN